LRICALYFGSDPIILDYDKPEPIYKWIDARIEARKSKKGSSGKLEKFKQCDNTLINDSANNFKETFLNGNERNKILSKKA